MRKMDKPACCMWKLLLGILVFTSCERYANPVSGGEEELAVTRVSINKIIQSTDLNEGDDFQMMIYNTGPVNTELLYATVDATVGADGTIGLTSYYPHLVKTGDTGFRSDLYLPSGNYRWFAYMTPQGEDKPVADTQNRELTFTREMDLMVAVNDVVIAYDSNLDVNQQAKDISWVHPFYHQSSQVVFRIEHEDPDASELVGKNIINLKEIVLSNINEEGVCTMPLTDALPEGQSICVVEPSASAQKTATVTLQVDEDAESDATFTNNGSPAVTTCPFLLVPTTDATGMRIKVRLQCDFLLENSDVTITAISQDDKFKLEPGKRFTITLKIRKDRPLLVCTVTDWGVESGDIAEIEDDKQYVGGMNIFTVDGWILSENQADEVGNGEVINME